MSSDKTLVYVSGAPGSGKSTLMAHLTRACPRDTRLTPFAHDVLHLPAGDGSTAVELGRRRETFSGTDALSMSVQPRAVAFLTEWPGTLLLGEGDRLANMNFLGAAWRAGYTVHLIHLHTPQELLDERCAERGSEQNPQWRAGRVTKAIRLAATAEAIGFAVHTLDGRNDVPCLSASAVAAVPALAALLPPEAPERAT